MKKQIINIGDEFVVDFIKNKNGGKPICRIDGIVGFIDPKERSFVASCSSWTVAVKEIRETCLIVTPLLKMKPAKENIQELSQRIDSLRQHTVKTVKHVKEKLGYQYKSFQELKDERILL